MEHITAGYAKIKSNLTNSSGTELFVNHSKETESRGQFSRRGWDKTGGVYNKDITKVITRASVL